VTATINSRKLMEAGNLSRYRNIEEYRCELRGTLH
jgi:hypothetical protein